MNLLDTFLFMFESDTSSVEKGMKSGDAAAKELKKSIDAADFSADKLAANFIKMAKNGVTALGSILALGAIKTLVNDTAAHTAAVALQARAIDMNVETLSAYQHAVMNMGGTAEQATGTLTALRDKFVEMSRFGVMVGPDAFMFRQLGLSAKDMQESIKDPTIALEKLAGTFEKLNHTQQLYIGKKLGLDQGTIALLSQGRRAFDEMIAKQRELGVVTQAQADAAIKYKIVQTELGLTFETVKREIATQLLPAFTWAVKALDNVLQFARQHKGFLIGFFGAIATVVAVALAPALWGAATAAWALIAPLLLAAAPFIAIAAAIGLVIDDIEKYRSGQNSLIGEIFKKWPAAKDLIKGTFDTMKGSLMAFLTVLQSVWDYFAALLQFFANVITMGPSKALDVLHDKVGAIADRIKNAFGKVWDGLKEYGKGVVGTFNQVTGKTDSPAASPDQTLSPGETEINPPLPVSKQQQRAAPVASGDTSASSAPDAHRLSGTALGREIADKLFASGKWTREQAAGIAGSFMQESRGRADITNPNSGAYGLGQWLGQRVKDFEKWSGRSLKGSSLDQQIAFFNYETEHSEKRAGDKIRATTTAADAAAAHSKYYERPGAAEANIARRQEYAQQIAMAGQEHLAATNTPLASQSSQSIANTYGGSRSVSVTTGDTHIHTPATDTAAIASQFTGHVTKQFNSALDAHDDGVLI